ncbi:MAG: hypothetical protein ACHQ5A_04800 [Opitutales bacterium]
MKLQVSLNPSWPRELAPDDRRFWLLRSVALRIVIRTDPLWDVEIYWKRLLAAGTILLVAGYLALVTAAWWWWARNPHNEVRWTDAVLAPVRWQQLQRQRGDTAIATALDQLKQKDYTDAYYGLRLGLARSPANTPARVVLAYMLSGQDPAQSLSLLEEGLRYTPGDLDLLHALFGAYAAQQAGALALTRAEELLTPGHAPAVSSEARCYVGLLRCSLLIEAGRLPEADHALSEIQALATSPTDLSAWNRLKIGLLLRRENIPEAQAWLRGHFSPGSTAPEDLNLAAEIALASGDEEALSIALRRMKLASSDSVGEHLLAYRTWHRAKKPARLQAEESEFFALFGSNDAALQALAALAVNLEHPETIQRVSAIAKANHLSTFAFQVHLTELALRQGKFEEAFRQTREWEQGVDTLASGQRFYPQLVLRLVHACVTGGEQPARLLLGTLSQGRGQAQSGVYRLAVETLERSGNLAAAQQIAAAGLRLYPASDSLLAARDRLQLNQDRTGRTGEIAATAPTIAIPATAGEALHRVDAALAAGNPVQARDLLSALRDHPPAWFEAQEGEFAAREVVLSLQTEDLISARARVGDYLARHRNAAGALRLVALARDYLARHRPAEARLLHDAIAAQPGLLPAVRDALATLDLPDDLSVAAVSPASALAALDQYFARRQYADADRLLTYLRDRKPDWLASAATDLAVREVPLRFALDQRPLAMSVFKEIVVLPGAPRSAAFRLVRDLLARGDPEQARLLAQETVRLLPDQPAAAKLLQEVEKAGAPGG